MTGRAYMGEVLIKVCLRNKVIAQTNECTKREFEKNFRGSHKLPQAHKKVCDENERKKQGKKRRAPKTFFDGRKEFIRPVQKTHVMDIKRLQVNDSSYLEGTICLVNELIQ